MRSVRGDGDGEGDEGVVLGAGDVYIGGRASLACSHWRSVAELAHDVAIE